MLAEWMRDGRVRLLRTVRGWIGATFRRGTVLRVTWCSGARGRPVHMVDRSGRHICLSRRSIRGRCR